MEKNFINISKLRYWRKPHLTSRLPEHYYKHRRQLELPSSVGYDEKPTTKLLDYDWADRRTGRVERKPITKVPVLYPVESDHGLWHGEGVVKGHTIPERKIKEMNLILFSQVWFPKLIRSVLYSEILDTYFRVIITPKTKDAINELFGFDFYILKTPIQNLKSQFGLDLRRQMLIRLAKKDYFPNDPEKHKMIDEKYGQLAIPLEEAEWFGLDLPAAIQKQHLRELGAKKLMPLKVLYAKNLIDELNVLKESKDKDFKKFKEEITGEKTSLLSRVTDKLPFFKRKS